MADNTTRIGFLHYHLAGGGVYTVLANQVRAMITHAKGRLIIEIITCDAEQADGQALIDGLRDWAKQNHPKKDTHICAIQINGLEYNERAAQDKNSFWTEAEQLADEILKKISVGQCSKDRPYLLHVHNTNMGKNARVTAAIKIIADRFESRNMPGWVLYQMHDFAEDNRPGCWLNLRNCTGKADTEFAVEIMYPRSSRILWACINSADRELLLKIGIDKNQVVVLPNAVDIDSFAAPALSQMSQQELAKLGLKDCQADFDELLKKRVAEYAAENGYRFEKDRKILFAPVKTIRRKNIYESVLLLIKLNHIDDSHQLLFTLNARSRDDIAYSQAIQQLVKDNNLPVVFGIGEALLKSGSQRKIKDGQVKMFSMVDMLHLSQAVVTTSVQEGFGYVFHEAWLAGRAVIGRNIEKVTRDFTAAGMKLRHLYNHLLVPMQLLTEQSDEIQEPYFEKTNRMRRTIELGNIECQEFGKLFRHTKVHSIKGNKEEMIDWADLPIECQLLLLQRFIDDTSLLDSIIWTDSEYEAIEGWYKIPASAIIIHNRAVVKRKYDLSATADSLRQLYLRGQKLISSQAATDMPLRSNAEVLANFVDLANIRLLT